MYCSFLYILVFATYPLQLVGLSLDKTVIKHVWRNYDCYQYLQFVRMERNVIPLTSSNSDTISLALSKLKLSPNPIKYL